MDHAHSRTRNLKLCRHLPAQLSLFAFQEGRPVRVFRDLGHVSLADVVQGMADAAFAISRERVETIDPSWPAAEADGGVRVHIDPRVLREVVPPPPPGSEVAVTVTCHAAYLKWLRGCLESIDAQDPEPAERILALDGCEPPEWLEEMPWWQVVRGNWGAPAPGRNEGMRRTRSPWLIWFDADNEMPPGYLEAVAREVVKAPHKVAVLYPDLDKRDEDLRPAYRMEMPEYDYWELRRANMIDTCAAWRRDAVEQIGGFSGAAANEDWGMALALTEMGWEARKLREAPGIVYREHRACRHLAHGSTAKAWHWRSLAVVTLFAGRREFLPAWQQWMNYATLPPRTVLYVVDNSRDPGWRSRVLKHLDRSRLSKLVYVEAPGKPRDASVLGVHRHIADLYNRVLPQVTEDLVLVLEDDVEPPLDAVERLVGSFNCGSTVGAAGGAYPCRSAPECATAARNGDWWTDLPDLARLPAHSIEVGFIGAGCTLYGNWALRKCPPCRADTREGKLFGWDAHLSRDLRDLGYKVLLDGSVRCKHQGMG